MTIKGYHGTNHDTARQVELSWSLEELMQDSGLGRGLYFYTDNDKISKPSPVFLKNYGTYRSQLIKFAVVSADIHVERAEHVFNIEENDVIKSEIDKIQKALEQILPSETGLYEKSIRLLLNKCDVFPDIVMHKTSILHKISREQLGVVRIYMLNDKCIDKKTIKLQYQ